nr:PREDICTED: uncharacterized mitochondrial protein AtMg00810-like [Daucus carota subsp. sativus]
MLLVYVDDIILTGFLPSKLSTVNDFLGTQFKLKNLGPLKYFLGLEIERSRYGISVHQKKYALNILASNGMLNVKPSSITMQAQHSLQNTSGLILNVNEATAYRRLVGQLIYLTITRLDITYSVHILSQFLAHPTDMHRAAALRLVRYIKNAPTQDWAACPMTRRSLSGYCVLLGDSLISWKCKKQNTVARSSAEAEYRSMANAICEVTWIYNFLTELKFKIPRPIVLYCDNNSAIHIAENPVLHERTKHIELDCQLIRDRVKEGFILPTYLSTVHQPADILTKALPAHRLQQLLSKLRVVNQPVSNSNLRRDVKVL